MTEIARRIGSDGTQDATVEARPPVAAPMPPPAARSRGRRSPRALVNLVALRADPRQAIQEDSIRCLICGLVFRQLTNTHLRAHNVGALEYKRLFGYNRGRPLMCRVLQRLYAERAVRFRLADRIRSRPILIEPGLRRLGGSRPIALEEQLTRRDARQRVSPSSADAALGG